MQARAITILSRFFSSSCWARARQVLPDSMIMKSPSATLLDASIPILVCSSVSLSRPRLIVMADTGKSAASSSTEIYLRSLTTLRIFCRRSGDRRWLTARLIVASPSSSLLTNGRM